jgi:cardiolipin synthase (CMP-forming)
MSLRWLPNAISLLRIALVAPILLLIIDARYDLALVLLIVAGVSDGIDGYIAKRFDWHSRIGSLLDPAADKILVAATFVTMVYAGLAPLWLAAVVILRDIVIVAGVIVYNVVVGPMDGEPTRISKLNTALELLFIVCALALAAFAWPPEAVVITVGAAVLVTVVISGIDYVWSWTRRASPYLSRE